MYSSPDAVVAAHTAKPATQAIISKLLISLVSLLHLRRALVFLRQDYITNTSRIAPPAMTLGLHPMQLSLRHSSLLRT
jgi:hypothetical protein